MRAKASAVEVWAVSSFMALVLVPYSRGGNPIRTGAKTGFPGHIVQIRTFEHDAAGRNVLK
jgi:hypothetical protein